ncbi:MAG: ribosome maturation factor [Saprospiraceae bacterium]|nr:ribosome maturation factor [Saprospiraceae bacterium]
MEITARITQLLEEKFITDETFSDCFIVDLELSPTKKLGVFIDSDSGFTFEKCQKISRYLESYLDENGWLGESYVLEVSSPGIGRPLKFPRQYRNNIGRNLSVTVQNQEQPLSGKVLSADDTQVVLVNTVIERDGKKKKEVVVETPVLYEQIIKAVVKLDF